ncbi:hypothetical protein KI387_020300, partial [Taxus chinensis]
ISETVIEDRFGLEHGSEAWYGSLDMHYKWLLQYKISAYFYRWGDKMTYTCPWPVDHRRAEEYYSGVVVDHRRAEEYYSDPRLAVYAVPYAPPLNSEQYDVIRSMSNEIKSLTPDARVLTTYNC